MRIDAMRAKGGKSARRHSQGFTLIASLLMLLLLWLLVGLPLFLVLSVMLCVHRHHRSEKQQDRRCAGYFHKLHDDDS